MPDARGRLGYTAAVDFETMYRAVKSRDARFDGRVFVGVLSTGIYCRPICPAPMPTRGQVSVITTVVVMAAVMAVPGIIGIATPALAPSQVGSTASVEAS